LTLWLSFLGQGQEEKAFQIKEKAKAKVKSEQSIVPMMNYKFYKYQNIEKYNISRYSWITNLSFLFLFIFLNALRSLNFILKT
jgi:hypothetical protein